METATTAPRVPTNHGIRLREARAVSVHFLDGTVSIRRSWSPKRSVVTGENRSQGDKRSNARCALCRTSLTGKNATREHVLPNAIGGRKKVRNFLCVACNSTTGKEWDSELVEQLRPLCTMLNVSRERGENRRFDVESVSGKRLTLQPDGSMTIAEPRFEKEEVDGGTAVKIQARTMRELREMLAGLKKDHPEMDVDELMKQAEWVRHYVNEAYAVSLDVGGLVAGRSMIKSCLAMVYDAGLEIGYCEEAEHFLLQGGPPCFVLYTERDLVRERPEKTFFHCVQVRGDPNWRQLIAYVEYFGSWRYLARLSKNYDGHAFSHCYAVDPLSGKEVN